MRRDELDHVEQIMINRLTQISGSNMKALGPAVAFITQRPDWQVNLRKLIKRAVLVINNGIIREKRDDFSTKLTSTSLIIGRMVTYKESDASEETLILIGDLFIESLYNKGLIDILQPMLRRYIDDEGVERTVNSMEAYTMFIKWKSKAEGLPYKEGMDEVRLEATSEEQFKLTSENVREFNDRGFKVIKKSDRNLELDLTQDYITGLDKLQSQSWCVNTRVMDATIANKHMFVDGEDMSLESKGKRRTFDTVMSKASVLKDSPEFYQLYDMDYRGRYYSIEPYFEFQGQDFARGLFSFAESKPMTNSGWFWLYVHTASVFNQTYSLKEIEELMSSDDCWFELDYLGSMSDTGLDTISVDKMSLNDRAAWTEHHKDMILELGDNAEFWKNSKGTRLLAEKPVSFLACCIEISKLVRTPEEGTNLPVAADGSSNGWQHLSAMARDGQSAALMGMTEALMPDDFYLRTGKRMLEILEGSNEPEKRETLTKLRKMSMKEIRKGVSKRGSMTRAYSAGAGAIAENMFSDCKQENYDKRFGLTVNDCTIASRALVKAIKEVCPGPLDTMKFFMSLAAHEIGTYGWFDSDGNDVKKHRAELKEARKELVVIMRIVENGGEGRKLTNEELDKLNDLSKELNGFEQKLIKGNGSAEISWETPAGFPVASSHFFEYQASVRGVIKGLKAIGGKKSDDVNHVVRRDTDITSARKTISAVSPNIVHSYDASHVAITAANWEGAFAAIHDSYNTHCVDMEDMIVLIKSVFKWMYEDIDFYSHIKGQILSDDSDFDKENPAYGDYDFNNLDKADFFFA